MKLGPTARKKFTKLHEVSRTFFSSIDYLLWVALDPARFKVVRKKDINKILVVLINRKDGNVGGDFCTLGIMNNFHKEHPEVGLHILSDKKTLNQFGATPGIEKIEYKNRLTLEKIQKIKFDAVIMLHPNGLSVRDFSFIPHRIGKTALSFGSFFKLGNKFPYTRKVYNSLNQHMIELRFKMFEALDFEFTNKKPEIQFSRDESNKVNAFLKKSKLKNFIILHPGGKHVVETYKKGKIAPHLWPLERYAEVADNFSKRKYDVLITGSKEESVLAEEINKISKKEIKNMCGKFSIKEIGVLLKKAKCLIATDTSVVHLAYQVGTPIVELMGPSLPEVVGAWPLNSPKHKILVDNGPCSRSMKKKECPEDIICLGEISANSVISAAEKLLKKHNS